MKTILRIGIVVVILCLSALPIQAQDKDKKETPYWYCSFVKVSFSKIDTLVKLEKEYVIPIVKEAIKNGTIIDYKMLLHHTGDEYNVVYMIKFPTWCALEKPFGWIYSTYKAMEPAKKKQDKMRAALSYANDGFIHYDAIYTEVE